MLTPEQAVLVSILTCMAGAALTLLVARNKLVAGWLAFVVTSATAILIFVAVFEVFMRGPSAHPATFLSMPNFGFALCLDKISEASLEGLDLSSLRMVANGAEPVSAETLRRFIDRFGRYGFPAGAMAPVYGLAESSVGLAFPPLGRLPIVDRVDRERLSAHGFAAPAKPGDPRLLEIVACGQPLPGHEIRIVDEAGHELGERREGRLEFRGPSTTRSARPTPLSPTLCERDGRRRRRRWEVAKAAPRFQPRPSQRSEHPD